MNELKTLENMLNTRVLKHENRAFIFIIVVITMAVLATISIYFDIFFIVGFFLPY
ncbi:hypothetical protein KKJ25_19850 [Xenorhabdus bovienii]|uniref:hypothetical protein n=1 Tax=Xenorhabdus bovienii TaxID=40576 RepID=UPI00237C89D5|nr:hypothetical protein [Xenorhabdus bovienii]MDE1497121.1 hypothetical protein [Xenorhabdus bovienii]